MWMRGNKDRESARPANVWKTNLEERRGEVSAFASNGELLQ